MQNYMSYYGLDFGLSPESEYIAGFSQDTNLSDTKRTANGIVEAFADLPKELVTFSGVSQINLGNAKGNTMGTHDTYNGKINIATVSKLSEVFSNVADAAINTDSNDIKQVVLHEVSHGLEHKIRIFNNALVESGDDSYRELSDTAILRTQLWEPLKGAIVGRTSTVGYGLTNYAEYTAETGRGLLGNTKDGLANPGEVRQYNSESQKAMFQMLIQLEQEIPGIAAYIVAHNQNLVPNN